MKRSITLYIPCFNSERRVGPAIKGAPWQPLVPDEILIIDGGSTDRTVELHVRA
jgi:glycosyltransferase involved in cell wall biosynthesis